MWHITLFYVEYKITILCKYLNQKRYILIHKCLLYFPLYKLTETPKLKVSVNIVSVTTLCVVLPCTCCKRPIKEPCNCSCISPITDSDHQRFTERHPGIQTNHANSKFAISIPVNFCLAAPGDWTNWQLKTSTAGAHFLHVADLIRRYLTVTLLSSSVVRFYFSHLKSQQKKRPCQLRKTFNNLKAKAVGKLS